MSRLIDQLPAPTEEPNFKIVVLSRSRVGTFSIYQSLIMLGYRPFHMYEVVKGGIPSMNLLREALQCKYEGAGKPYDKADFDKWLAGYDAIVEIPQFFLDEFMDYYPNAKFILTERDLDAWVTSVDNTAGVMFKMLRTIPFSILRRFDSWIESYFQLHVVIENVFCHGLRWNTPEGVENARQDTVEGQEKVRKTLPKEKLLAVKLEDGFGWEELCPFLGHDIPSERYPRGNAPAQFKELVEEELGPRVRRAGIAVFTGIVVPLASFGAWYYMKRR